MRRIARAFATILFAPVGIALGLLAFGTLAVMAIPVSVRGFFEHRRWLREMRRSERMLTPAEIAGRGGSGSLIVDQPGWGGKLQYCWWTPDDIAATAPVPITPLPERIESMNATIDADCLPLDRWIYETYLSHDNGTAFLIATKHGNDVAVQLQAEIQDLQVIETWSAPVGTFGT